LKKPLGRIIFSIKNRGISGAEGKSVQPLTIIISVYFSSLYPSSVIVKPFSQSSQETGAIYLKNLGTVLPMASVHGTYYSTIHLLGEREARSRARNT